MKITWSGSTLGRNHCHFSLPFIAVSTMENDANWIYVRTYFLPKFLMFLMQALNVQNKLKNFIIGVLLLESGHYAVGFR